MNRKTLSLGALLLLGTVAATGSTASWLEPPPQEAAKPMPPHFTLPPSSRGTGGNCDANASEALKVTLADAVVMALSGNRAFLVERYNPSVAETGMDAALSVFDPVISGTASLSRQKNGTPEGVSTVSGEVSARKTYPSGTTLGVEASARTSPDSITLNQDSARLGLSVSQALARGFSREANLAALKGAGLEVGLTAFGLRGTAQELAAQVQTAYYDVLLAKRQVTIAEEALALSLRQEEETLQRINLGKLAEVEAASAKAEAALDRERLINAQSGLKTSELRLSRLLGVGIGRPLECVDEARLPEKPLDPVAEHVELARSLRPDLNEARLRVLQGDLELVKTKDGLLPKLDLFMRLGKSGYGDNFTGAAENFGNAYDFEVGITGELALGKRGARASDRRALLLRDQSEEALKNLSELAELDVRLAYLEVERLSEQIAATRATLAAQSAVYEGEVQKYRVGRSTSFLVAQAQKNFNEAKVSSVAAEIEYLKAIIDLYRRDGSLLKRLGIDAPGGEAVVLTSQATR